MRTLLISLHFRPLVLVCGYPSPRVYQHTFSIGHAHAASHGTDNKEMGRNTGYVLRSRETWDGTGCIVEMWVVAVELGHNVIMN